MKSYLSAKQVAQRLNWAISVKQVYRLCALGRLRSTRALGKVLIEEDSLLELLEPPTPPPVPEMPAPPIRPRGRPRKERLKLW